MMFARFFLPTAAAVVIAAALPATASAQRHVHTQPARPVHVVTSPAPAHAGAEHRDLRTALLRAEREVDTAEAAALPFDEPDSLRHVRLARTALDRARGELGPFGSEFRFFAHLEDAEQHASAANARVRELTNELAGLRSDAERALRQASQAGRFDNSGRVARLVDDAAREIDDAQRAEWRRDYTDARAHYASAIDTAQAASALAVRYDWRDDRGYGGGRDDHGHGHDHRYAPVPATPVDYGRNQGGCDDRDSRSGHRHSW